VTFLPATGIRWGEAAALQVKDIHLGGGTEADPPWVYVHKTWKRIGRCGDRTKAAGRKQRKGAQFVWGRGRTKTAAGRRRITLTQGIRAELLPLLAGRDPQAPVFTGKDGGILQNSNFSERYLIPALQRARNDLAVLRAAAPNAHALAQLPLETPASARMVSGAPAAWLLSAGVPEARQAFESARSMIESSLDSLVSISPEGKITDVNEATVKVTGVPRANLIGTAFSECFTEPEKGNAIYQLVFDQGMAVDYPLTRSYVSCNA
jgi:PAS domain-containing protein